jgi:hypothetical protein
MDKAMKNKISQTAKLAREVSNNRFGILKDLGYNPSDMAVSKLMRKSIEELKSLKEQIDKNK